MASILAVLLMTIALAGPALAAPTSEIVCRGDESRVALLIGNQAYAPPMQPLTNPRRDSAAFGQLLCRHGFTVFRHGDLDIRTFDRTIQSFNRAAKQARTAIIYYSGHGFAVGRRNWLVPVDAGLTCEDVAGDDSIANLLKRRLIDLDDDVLSRIEGSADQIVILDACRTDPVRGCRGGASLSLVKGLVRPSTNARLIVYATEDGQVALDAVAGSTTSPLMTAILKRLPDDPKRDWVSAMLDVSEEVLSLTDRRQRPTIDVNLRPRGCLAPDCDAVASLASARAEFEFAERINTREVWEAYLGQYPTGLYAVAARAKLSALVSSPPSAAAAPGPQPLPRPAEIAGPSVRIETPSPSAAPQVAAPPPAVAAPPAIVVLPAPAELPPGPLAALPATPRPEAAPPAPTIPPADVARLLQTELKRVGCEPSKIDGDWGPSSQHALELFNKHAGTSVDTKVASLTALEAVRGKTDRVCPLECGRGYRVSGNQCVRIVCGPGTVLAADGACRKKGRDETPSAARKQKDAPPRTATRPTSGNCFTFNGKRFCE